MKQRTKLPKFARIEVLEGLQKLVMLRPEGAPPGSGIRLTASVWFEALVATRISWDEQLDKGRITVGFTRLFMEIDRWPTPKMLIERLPPRPEPLKLEAPRKVWTEEEIKRNKERLAEMVDMLTGKMIETNQFFDEDERK